MFFIFVIYICKTTILHTGNIFQGWRKLPDSALLVVASLGEVSVAGQYNGRKQECTCGLFFVATSTVILPPFHMSAGCISMHIQQALVSVDR